MSFLIGWYYLPSFIPIQPAAGALGLAEDSIHPGEGFLQWLYLHDHTLLAEDREVMVHRMNAGTRLLPLPVLPP